jgi:putative transcriptional regulator
MENRIKVYRAIHDTTQEELANKLGVSRQTILAIEKNKYDPSLKLALNMAKFFNISVEELFILEEEIEGKQKNKRKKKKINLKRSNIYTIFSLPPIFGLIGSIFSSFYVNRNKKIESILLMMVGVLIFFYFTEFFNPYQMSYYNNLTYVHVITESLITYNLGGLSGIILFIGGIIEIIKNDLLNEDFKLKIEKYSLKN